MTGYIAAPVGEWRHPEDNPPQKGAKLLLLSPGGIAVTGEWMNGMAAWMPLPKINKVPAGIAISLPDGYVGRILPRSGLAVRNGIDMLAGVIDSSYRGEVVAVLINHSSVPFSVYPGDRIAQLVIQKVELWTPQVVDELDDTERGEKGFGSTEGRGNP